MSCFICKHDGTRICDPVEAETRCLLCGRCEAERLLAETMIIDQYPSAT